MSIRLCARLAAASQRLAASVAVASAKGPCQRACPALAAPRPLQARIQRETNDAKNALEAYIYGLRNKL